MNTASPKKQSPAQAAFEKARRDWLGPDVTDEEARRLATLQRGTDG